MSTITVYVRFGNEQKKTVKISPQKKISDLVEELKKQDAKLKTVETIRLVFNSTKLDPNKTLEDYDITDMSEVTSVIPTIAGSNPIDLFGEDGIKVEMSCGHSVLKNVIASWWREELQQGHLEFTCPFVIRDPNTRRMTGVCKKNWKPSELKSKGTLSNQEFDNYLNTLKKLLYDREGYKNCPYESCKQDCFREKDNNILQQVCNTCNKKFCWDCQRPWIGSSTNVCGNVACEGSNKSKQVVLDNAAKKNIGTIIDVPSIRACPTCFQLVEHEANCKIIRCTSCQVFFCMSCLDTKPDPNTRYSCGGAYAPCPKGVAPIQKL
jgi:hypothetical protein